MEKEKIKIIRSGRKTSAIEITSDGEIIFRAPRNMNDEKIFEILSRKKLWIEKYLEKIKRARQTEKFTDDEIRKMTERAYNIIPGRVEYFAARLGVSYGKITVRHQKTRWGSCSSEGNLNFNCLLILVPTEVLDSVVVHELCHRFEMNHSAEFYRCVKSVFPEYEKCRAWLRENGRALIMRIK